MESQRDAHSPASSLQTSLLPSDSDEDDLEFAPSILQHPPPRPDPIYPEESNKSLHVAAGWGLVCFILLLFLPTFLISRPHVGQPPTSRKSPSMAAFSNDAASNLLNPTFSQLKKPGLNSSNDILLVYSGMGHHRQLLNDTFAFDLQTRQWTRVLTGKHEAKEPHPDPRWKSAAVSMLNKGLLVLFGDAMNWNSSSGGGGASSGEGAPFRKFDDQVWMLELPKLKWQPANVISKQRSLPAVLPQARRDHSVVAMPSSNTSTITLVLFGGVSSEGKELNDSWKATISWPNITWTELGRGHSSSTAPSREGKHSPFVQPSPRHGHATALLKTSIEIQNNLRNQQEQRQKEEINQPVKQYLVVFGGRNETQFFNDLWLLNLENSPQNDVNNDIDNKKGDEKSDWLLFELDDASPIPPPRAHHTIAIYEDKIYLWGGLSGPRVGISKPLDDLWVLSLENRRWYRLYKHGAWPLPRFLFASVVYQPTNAAEPRMYIFGGESFDRCKLNDLWSLNLKTFIWSQLTPNYFARQRCDKLFGGNSN